MLARGVAVNCISLTPQALVQLIFHRDGRDALDHRALVHFDHCVIHIAHNTCFGLHLKRLAHSHWAHNHAVSDQMGDTNSALNTGMLAYYQGR